MHGGWPLGERGGGGGGGGGGGAVVLIPNWEQLGIGNFGDKLGASWELGIGSARSLGTGWEPGSPKKTLLVPGAKKNVSVPAGLDPVPPNQRLRRTIPTVYPWCKDFSAAEL